jgi:hypothetical protein
MMLLDPPNFAFKKEFLMVLDLEGSLKTINPMSLLYMHVGPTAEDQGHPLLGDIDNGAVNILENIFVSLDRGRYKDIFPLMAAKLYAGLLPALSHDEDPIFLIVIPGTEIGTLISQRIKAAFLMEDITTVAAETYPLQLLGFTEVKEAVGAADAFYGLICRQYLFFPLTSHMRTPFPANGLFLLTIMVSPDS